MQRGAAPGTGGAYAPGPAGFAHAGGTIDQARPVPGASAHVSFSRWRDPLVVEAIAGRNHRRADRGAAGCPNRRNAPAAEPSPPGGSLHSASGSGEASGPALLRLAAFVGPAPWGAPAGHAAPAFPLPVGRNRLFILPLQRHPGRRDGPGQNHAGRHGYPAAAAHGSRFTRVAHLPQAAGDQLAARVSPMGSRGAAGRNPGQPGATALVVVSGRAGVPG